MSVFLLLSLPTIYGRLVSAGSVSPQNLSSMISPYNTSEPTSFLPDDLKKRQATAFVSTCGFLNGDASQPRTADAGFNCRVDTQNALWGFCPTTVIAATDCGLAGNCVDSSACKKGCGIVGNPSITTFTWYVRPVSPTIFQLLQNFMNSLYSLNSSWRNLILITSYSNKPGASFCSTALLTAGPDQTYSYIACGTAGITESLLAVAITTPARPASSVLVQTTVQIPSTSASSTSPSGTTSSSASPSTSFVSFSSITTSSALSSGTISQPSVSGSAFNAATGTTTSNTSGNIGAIVGGAIGGLALVCIVVLGILFLRRHKHNHRKVVPKHDIHDNENQNAWLGVVDVTPKYSETPLYASQKIYSPVEMPVYPNRRTYSPFELPS
jgi:hypothetical protein